MRVLTTVAAALVMGLAQSGPVVLSRDDIGDHYDKHPDDLRSTKGWLGLFITEDRPGGQHGESRIAMARVRFVKSGEPNGGLKMETTPPNATLLVSGVRRVLPGPAITVVQSVELSHEEPEVQIRFRDRLYTIRLLSREPDYCDAVISLTSDAVTQNLFDIRIPPPQWSCDEPHFKIHWAGDLDRDGWLDLLVTFSEKYSYHPRQLLLSSAARGQDLVGAVARYEHVSE
jgi:hypothetical protein